MPEVVGKWKMVKQSPEELGGFSSLQEILTLNENYGFKLSVDYSFRIEVDTKNPERDTSKDKELNKMVISGVYEFKDNKLTLYPKWIAQGDKKVKDDGAEEPLTLSLKNDTLYTLEENQTKEYQKLK